MKPILSIFPVLLLSALSLFSTGKTGSPLDDYSKEWGNERFNVCYTAAGANYMSEKEKEVIHILNLLRSDPPLFASTVLEKYPEKSGQLYLENLPEFKSLMTTLEQLEPR